MLPSPSSSPRPAFADHTNISRNIQHPAALLSFLTPPLDSRNKRRVNENPVSNKRIRLCKDVQCKDVTESKNEVDDVEMIPVERVAMRRRRTTTYGVMKAMAMGVGPFPGSAALSSRPFLESFVSSHKSDVYKCHSIASSNFLAPPYACAFSHDSKRGRASTLAVATEQGTLEIFNTAQRLEWEIRPPLTTLQAHQNGVFDVKWSSCDSLLATASGDHTARIIDLRSEKTLHILRGHTSTVKCVTWDPNHRELVSTAGRDGYIRLWDLREKASTEGQLFPVTSIPGAHEIQAGEVMKKGKATSAARSVTSLVYLPHSSYEIISSGSTDGILRKWDLRCPSASGSARSKKAARIVPIDESILDPTLQQSRRPRGISSLALGSGPSEALLFGLGNDSKIHTYNPCGASGIPLHIAQGHTMNNTYVHERMATNSFYVRIGVSPCGRWLASGGSNGSAFLFDVGGQRRGPIIESGPTTNSGLELKGQVGEVGALDWADGQLATCADDGTVRIWRPNGEVQKVCVDNPEEAQWNWSWARP